jgi:hypothetical protein
VKIEISKKTKFLFLGVLFTSLVISLSVQISFFTPDALEIVTFLSYLTNFIICVASFYVLASLSKKDSTNVGYAFLMFSMMKFGAYFLGFRFYFQIDDVVTKQEYAVFFVPYLLAILVEISFLIKELNGAEMDPEKFIVVEEEGDESLHEDEEE